MPAPDDTAAQQLAKDILDELDKPTSKEREEQMAQKERDDSEALQSEGLAQSLAIHRLA